jgi:hypothetical protein
VSAPRGPTLTVEERRKRLRFTGVAMVAGAAAAAVGIAASMFGQEALGMPLTLGGIVLLGWALHLFGRSGADPADGG